MAVGGNLKFDSAPPELGPEEKQTLAEELGFPDRVVLAAGSTHQGEEEPCLDAFAGLKKVGQRPGLAPGAPGGRPGRRASAPGPFAARGLWAG